ncbi:hypothetical protein NEMIN01_0978 [Nematocida minor]|uniref:uncharacterized protein n=1 Tax=Nematocida minor TaxID=1912983 RepID=UPI00221F140A|nr:uncharacterized protein NEMIN01_0978 [Nematocida minor]KAI5190279.1 hypothetical protein NEMIN01_0978 [Nematocida minor]
MDTTSVQKITESRKIDAEEKKCTEYDLKIVAGIIAFRYIICSLFSVIMQIIVSVDLAKACAAEGNFSSGRITKKDFIVFCLLYMNPMSFSIAAFILSKPRRSRKIHVFMYIAAILFSFWIVFIIFSFIMFTYVFHSMGIGLLDYLFTMCPLLTIVYALFYGFVGNFGNKKHKDSLSLANEISIGPTILIFCSLVYCIIITLLFLVFPTQTVSSL